MDAQRQREEYAVSLRKQTKRAKITEKRAKVGGATKLRASAGGNGYAQEAEGGFEDPVSVYGLMDDRSP